MSQILKPRKGYKLEKLKNLCIFSSGEFLPTKNQKKGNIPVFGGNGINGFHNKSLIKIPVIIIGRVGAYCGSIHLSEEQCWITDNAIFIEKLNEEIDVDYLFRFLSKININLLAEVSAQPKITQSILRNIIINYPIKKEQQKIASILSRVDALIESTQKIIEKTERLKKGLMQKLLTRGIGHDKFKKVLWLFGKEIEIPEEWEIKKLDQISDVIDPYPSHRAPKETQTGVPYLGIGDLDENGNILKISRYVDEKIFEEQRKFFKLDPNDIAIGRVASIGKVIKLKYDTRFTISPTLSIIKSKNESNYLIQILKSYRFQRQLHYYTTGSTRSSVGIQIIRKLLVFLPPLQEQQKIASILSNIDIQIQSLTQYKEKLERLKKSLMQKLLTGEVRVIV